MKTKIINKARVLNRYIRLAGLLCLLALLVMSSIAHASGRVSIARTLQPSSADSFLGKQNANTNYGTSGNISIRCGSANVARRGILKFDLTRIPTGSIILSANLSLYCYQKTGWLVGTNRTYTAHRVTSNWTETGCTWNNRIAATAWTTAGGDFVSAATSNASSNGTGTGFWMTWPVTGDVMAWRETQTATNYGWIIKDTKELETQFATQFYSLNYGVNTSLRPKLVVTYTAPWDSYESNYTTGRETYNVSYRTVYMKGTGLTVTTHNVAYYDAGTSGGQRVTTDNNKTPTGGTLQSLCALADKGAYTPGTWHALAQPTANSTAFPLTYNAAIAAPDTYNLIANDSFTVLQSAIPEFPTAITAIIVPGVCFWIYRYMRKRSLRYVKG